MKIKQLIITAMLIATPGELILKQVQTLWMVDGFGMKEFGEFVATYKGDGEPNWGIIGGSWDYTEWAAHFGHEIVDPVWGWYEGRWVFRGHYTDLTYGNGTLSKESIVTTKTKLVDGLFVFEGQNVKEVITIEYDAIEVAVQPDAYLDIGVDVEPPDPNVINRLLRKLAADPNDPGLQALYELVL